MPQYVFWYVRSEEKAVLPLEPQTIARPCGSATSRLANRWVSSQRMLGYMTEMTC